MRFHLVLIALVRIVFLLAVSGPAPAETAGGSAVLPSSSHRGDYVPNLGVIARHAGVIFSGAVVKVQHLNPDPSTTVATTQITFRVQTAIRGVRSGQMITVREWGGLWNNGERYRPGERVLLFLYPASRLGLTSPVGGRMGHFRVDDAGRVEVPAGGSGKRPKLIELRNFAAEIRRAARE